MTIDARSFQIDRRVSGSITKPEQDGEAWWRPPLVKTLDVCPSLTGGVHLQVSVRNEGDERSRGAGLNLTADEARGLMEHLGRLVAPPTDTEAAA